VEVPTGLESQGEAAAALDQTATTKNALEEAPDRAIDVAATGHDASAQIESDRSGGLVQEEADSSASISSPPLREEVTRGEDEGDLSEDIGEEGSVTPMAPSLDEALAAPDTLDNAPGRNDCEKLEPPAGEQPRGHDASEPPSGPVPVETGLAELPGAEAEQPSEPAESASPEQAPAARPRPSKPAQHRDRRGQRRPAQPKVADVRSETPQTPAAVPRTPAEAKLRLMIHPIRRTVGIAAVLSRPAGYPESVTLLVGAGIDVGAYSEDRYDDVDLEWTTSLLSSEVRLDSREGYQWLRSRRRVHIFSEQTDEPGLVSVGAVSLNSVSAVICMQEDVQAVRSAAAECGSPELVSHDRWTSVPEGWAVLSGYRPAHPASAPLDPELTTLDPGIGAEIQLSSGLQVRSGWFAQGSPPKIEIQPFPAGATVTIDGTPAALDSDGCWRAPGWDAPGDHLVDVVPGPSLSYRIVGDPWREGGWEFWDAHGDRFCGPNDAPWARAQICGASFSGPSGEHVLAAQPMSSVIALGLRRGVAVLRARPDAPVAVGLLLETPAFLISSSGPRRVQGRVDWLAPPAGKQLSRMVDPSWVAVVRSASSRRLALVADSPAAQEAWRRARTRARRYRRASP
jgi:hypothetical protein